MIVCRRKECCLPNLKGKGQFCSHVCKLLVVVSSEVTHKLSGQAKADALACLRVIRDSANQRFIPTQSIDQDKMEGLFALSRIVEGHERVG